MKRGNLFKIFGVLFVVFLCIVVCVFYIQNIYSKGQNNLATSPFINRGQGWLNNTSTYSGSEAQALITKTSKITFGFNSVSNASQSVEIKVGEDIYTVSSPHINNQLLTISVNKTKQHSVSIKHICTHELFPCEIKLTDLVLDQGGSLLPYTPVKKRVSILGDSISTIYGNNNYTIFLSQDLGYELHNASTLGSTLSKVTGVDNAINRYVKDLKEYKSDIVIIFLGTNDITNNVSLDTFRNDYEKIVKDVKKWNSETKIFLVGILPRNDIPSSEVTEYSEVIKSISNDNGVMYVDPTDWLSSSDFLDAMHPTSESQRKISNNFYKEISPHLN